MASKLKMGSSARSDQLCETEEKSESALRAPSHEFDYGRLEESKQPIKISSATSRSRSTSATALNVANIFDNNCDFQAPSTSHQSARTSHNAQQAGPHTLGELSSDQGQAQWLAQMASQTRQDVRERMSQASDQLNHSLRQLYASASSISSIAGAAVDVPPSYHNIPGVVPFYHDRTVGPPPSYDDVINPYASPPTYQSLFGQMREARKNSRGLLDMLRRLLVVLVSTLGCVILIASMILIPFTMIIVGAIYIDECKIEHIPAFLLVGGLIWLTKNILHCYSQCRKAEQQEQSEMLAVESYLANTANSNSSSPVATLQRPVHRATGATPGDEEVDDLQLGQRIHMNHQTHNHNLPPTSRHLSGRDFERARRFKSSVFKSLLNCLLFGWFIAGCVIVLRNYQPEFENTASVRYCNRTVYMYTFWLVTTAMLSFGFFIGCICCLMVSSAVANRERDSDLA